MFSFFIEQERFEQEKVLTDQEIECIKKSFELNKYNPNSDYTENIKDKQTTSEEEQKIIDAVNWVFDQCAMNDMDYFTSSSKNKKHIQKSQIAAWILHNRYTSPKFTTYTVKYKNKIVSNA
jgi:hypothetical protein